MIDDNPKTKRIEATWPVLGVAMGCGIGVALRNLALGVGIGMLLGATIMVFRLKASGRRVSSVLTVCLIVALVAAVMAVILLKK